jgi:hypothetical protein
MAPRDNSWQTFHFFLVTHFLKYGFDKDESETKANKYNFWGNCGFEYSDLKNEFEDFVFKTDNTTYVQKLHQKLIQQKDVVDKDVSLGDGINLGTVHN